MLFQWFPPHCFAWPPILLCAWVNRWFHKPHCKVRQREMKPVTIGMIGGQAKGLPLTTVCPVASLDEPAVITADHQLNTWWKLSLTLLRLGQWLAKELLLDHHRLFLPEATGGMIEPPAARHWNHPLLPTIYHNPPRLLLQNATL